MDSSNNSNTVQIQNEEGESSIGAINAAALCEASTSDVKCTCNQAADEVEDSDDSDDSDDDVVDVNDDSSVEDIDFNDTNRASTSMSSQKPGMNFGSFNQRNLPEFNPNMSPKMETKMPLLTTMEMASSSMASGKRRLPTSEAPPAKRLNGDGMAPAALFYAMKNTLIAEKQFPSNRGNASEARSTTMSQSEKLARLAENERIVDGIVADTMNHILGSITNFTSLLGSNDFFSSSLNISIDRNSELFEPRQHESQPKDQSDDIIAPCHREISQEDDETTELKNEFIEEAMDISKKTILNAVALNSQRVNVVKYMRNTAQADIFEVIRQKHLMKLIINEENTNNAGSMIYQMVTELTRYTPKPISKNMLVNCILKCDLRQLSLDVISVRSKLLTNKMVYNMTLDQIQLQWNSENLNKILPVVVSILKATKISEIVRSCSLELDHLQNLIDFLERLFIISSGAVLLFSSEAKELTTIVFSEFEKNWKIQTNKGAIIKLWKHELEQFFDQNQTLSKFVIELYGRINGLTVWHPSSMAGKWNFELDEFCSKYFTRPSRLADWTKAVLRSLLRNFVLPPSWNTVTLPMIAKLKSIFLTWLTRWVLVFPEVFVHVDPYGTFNANSTYAEELLKTKTDTPIEQEYKSKKLFVHYLKDMTKVSPTIAKEMIALFQKILSGRMSKQSVLDIFVRLHSTKKSVRMSLADNVRPLTYFNSTTENAINLDDIVPIACRITDTVYYAATHGFEANVSDSFAPRPVELHKKYENMVEKVAKTMYKLIKTIPFVERCQFVLTHPLLQDDLEKYDEFKRQTKISSNFFDDLFVLNSHISRLAGPSDMKAEFWDAMVTRRNILIKKMLNSACGDDERCHHIRDTMKKIIKIHRLNPLNLGDAIPDELSVFLYSVCCIMPTVTTKFDTAVNSFVFDCELNKPGLSKMAHADMSLFKVAFESTLNTVQKEITDELLRDDYKINRPMIHRPASVWSTPNIYAKALLFNFAMFYDTTANKERLFGNTGLKDLNKFFDSYGHSAIHYVENRKTLNVQCPGFYENAWKLFGTKYSPSSANASRAFMNDVKKAYNITNNIHVVNVAAWYYAQGSRYSPAALISHVETVRNKSIFGNVYGFKTNGTVEGDSVSDYLRHVAIEDFVADLVALQPKI